MAVSVLIVAPVVPHSLDDNRLAVNPLCSFSGQEATGCAGFAA